MNKRPLTITLLSWLFIAVGTAEFVYRVAAIHIHAPFHVEDVLLPLLEAALVVAGVFMLRGCNWARWLALAWLAFHVAISFLNGWQTVLVHGLIFALIAYGLFRADARAWFRARPATGA